MNRKVSKALATALLFLALPTLSGVIRGFDEPGPVHLGQTTANYLALNQAGIGHFLIAPYFSTQEGNVSAVSVTNTDGQNGKAVKVRFRGAANGDVLHSLTVLLGPNDVWNAAISADPVSGKSVLVSSDSTCTFPTLADGAVHRFSTNRLNPRLGEADLASNSREGYLEIMVMADIPLLTSLASASGSLFQSIQQGEKKLRNCGAPSVLNSQADVSTESAAAGLGFATPTTGLQGNLLIVNVPLTLTYSIEMIAIEARDSATGKAGRGNFVLFPQSNELVPNADNLTSDPALRTVPLSTKLSTGESLNYQPAIGGLPIVTPTVSDFPDFSTPYLSGLTLPSHQTIQLHKALAVKSIVNDYSVEASIGASTDWTFSMPSRRYSVGADYRQLSPVLVFSSSPSPGGGEYFSSENSFIERAMVCNKVDINSFFDRGSNSSLRQVEEKMCGAVPVMRFGSSSALFSKVSTFLAGANFSSGWGSVNTQNTVLLKNSTERPGLPIVGASFMKASNSATARGVSGNYGLTFLHKLER